MDRKEMIKELYRPARKNFLRRKMCVRGLNEHWSADLFDMKAYAKKNKGYTFVLLVVDSLSKFIYCEPIKKKNATSVYDAFVKIFKKSKIYPKNLQTDMGTEFYNRKLKKLFEEHGINHYSTYSTIKSAFAERSIRSIKQKIFMNFALRNNYIYHDILQDIVNEYNNTIHSKTKFKPIDVDDKIAKQLLKTVYYEPKVFISRPKFSVGERVRISKQKKFFEKGYTSKWRSEIFRVKKINYTNPITYMLEDLNNENVMGCFYELELAKTKF